MNIHIHYCLLLFIILGLFGSCKTTAVVVPASALEEISSEELTRQLDDKSQQILWLDGRASVTIQIEGKVDKFSSQVRIKTDSIFLANGKKVSVEGGRLQIRRDSFFLLNRINKSIEVRAYDHVADVFDIPFEFDELMNVILAKPLRTDLIPKNHVVRIDEDAYVLNQFSEEYKITYRITPINFDIISMNYANRITRQEVEILNQDFKEVSGIRFPHLRTFRFDGGLGRSITFKIHFSKLELNVPQKFQFKIPPGYTLLD